MSVSIGSYDTSIIRWVTANGRPIWNRFFHDKPLTCFTITGDGKVIASVSDAHILSLWDAISGQSISKTVNEQGQVSDIWTNYDGTKIVTWEAEFREIILWSVEPEGETRETSTLPLSNDVAKCAIDVNRGVAAVGLRSGAVAFCDIHWQVFWCWLLEKVKFTAVCG